MINEFRTLIESIGFKLNYDTYEYKEFIIDFYSETYYISNGSEWFTYVSYTDLTLIKKHFNQELRSIKLKQLLK